MKNTAIPLLALLAGIAPVRGHEPHEPAAAPAKPDAPVSEIDRLKSLAALKGAGAAVWVKLGDALMQQARDRVAHDFSEAAAAYGKALALQAENIDALAGMAWVKNSEHDFPAGRSWAEKVLALDPRQADAHALIGDGAVELGDYEEAFEHYQAALDARADLSTLSRAAHLLWITGDATQARGMMQRAIQAGGPYPENAAWCRAELALMNFHSGALLPAEQLVAKALEAAPGNPRILAIAGRIAAAKGDYPGAIGHYEKSAAITPNHDALAALVTLYQLTGDKARATRQAARVIAFHRPATHSHGHGHSHSHAHGDGNAQLARFYADHDRDLAEALKEAKAAHATYRNVATTDTLAWCLLKSGHAEEARKMIRRAMKWKTPDAELHFHAGMIERALRNDEAARRHFHQALSLNPAFHPVHAATAADLLKR